MKKRTALWTVLVVSLISIGIFLTYYHIILSRKNTTTTELTTQNPTPDNQTNDAEFDKTIYSLSDPSSLWVVVNKSHVLKPIDHEPTLVNIDGYFISSIASKGLENLMSAAAEQGIQLAIISSYRSYDTQTTIYNNYVLEYGQDLTDTFSARPGYSEHQTGLAVDFDLSSDTSCQLQECFENTTAGIWLVNNAANYGWILRYPEGKETITGYKYEPWHYRYVGVDLAAEMQIQNINTLEEFFNISGGEIYQ